MAAAGTPILVLAYHFPPVGGGGVQRNAKFIRYLQSYGYSPTVVTGPGRPSGHWTPHDGSMLDEIGETTPIFRTSGPERPLLKAVALRSSGGCWSIQLDALVGANLGRDRSESGS